MTHRKTNPHKCIYCLKDETQTSFRGSEHIIPVFLGGTKEMMLDKYVCDECNSGILNGYEAHFKVDSYEGIFSSMIGLKNKRTIRIADDALKYKLSLADGDMGIFKNIFPQITREGKIELRPQIHMKNKHNQKYEVIWTSSLVKPNKEFRQRLKERYVYDSIRIIADIEFTLEKTIKLLDSVGIPYKQKTYEEIPPEMNLPENKILIDFEGKISPELAKTPAKIAFNYILFCAMKSHLISSFYSDDFEQIREFLLAPGPEDPNKIIESISTDTSFNIVNSDILKNACVHIITFVCDDSGVIKANISIFNRFNYQIKIGKFPFHIQPQGKFGNGMVFDPFTGESTKLHASTSGQYLVIPDVTAGKFDLFSR